jgi:hypothetical protein
MAHGITPASASTATPATASTTLASAIASTPAPTPAPAAAATPLPTPAPVMPAAASSAPVQSPQQEEKQKKVMTDDKLKLYEEKRKESQSTTAAKGKLSLQEAKENYDKWLGETAKVYLPEENFSEKINWAIVIDNLIKASSAYGAFLTGAAKHKLENETNQCISILVKAKDSDIEPTSRKDVTTALAATEQKKGAIPIMDEKQLAKLLEQPKRDFATAYNARKTYEAMAYAEFILMFDNDENARQCFNLMNNHIEEQIKDAELKRLLLAKLNFLYVDCRVANDIKQVIRDNTFFANLLQACVDNNPLYYTKASALAKKFGAMLIKKDYFPASSLAAADTKNGNPKQPVRDSKEIIQAFKASCELVNAMLNAGSTSDDVYQSVFQQYCQDLQGYLKIGLLPKDDECNPLTIQLALDPSNQAALNAQQALLAQKKAVPAPSPAAQPAAPTKTDAKQRDEKAERLTLLTKKKSLLQEQDSYEFLLHENPHDPNYLKQYRECLKSLAEICKKLGGELEKKEAKKYEQMCAVLPKPAPQLSRSITRYDAAADIQPWHVYDEKFEKIYHGDKNADWLVAEIYAENAIFLGMPLTTGEVRYRQLVLVTNNENFPEIIRVHNQINYIRLCAQIAQQDPTYLHNINYWFTELLRKAKTIPILLIQTVLIKSLRNLQLAEADIQFILRKEQTARVTYRTASQAASHAASNLAQPATATAAALLSSSTGYPANTNLVASVAPIGATLPPVTVPQSPTSTAHFPTAPPPALPSEPSARDFSSSAALLAAAAPASTAQAPTASLQDSNPSPTPNKHTASPKR